MPTFLYLTAHSNAKRVRIIKSRLRTHRQKGLLLRYYYHFHDHQELHESASKVVSRGQDLVKARRVEKNIATTIESLSMCLPVLQTLSKLSKQMKEKRFHPALKTLEQLEHTYLPRIANYRCCYFKVLVVRSWVYGSFSQAKMWGVFSLCMQLEKWNRE